MTNSLEELSKKHRFLKQEINKMIISSDEYNQAISKLHLLNEFLNNGK